MKRNPDTFVGWAMALLALVFFALVVLPLPVHADEFKWVRDTSAQPCAPDAVQWRKVAWPIPSGQAAEVLNDDLGTCTIISGYSMEEAKHVRAAGPLSKDPTTLYEHELRHLLRAERHPKGEGMAGWNTDRLFGPPVADVRVLPRADWTR